MTIQEQKEDIFICIEQWCREYQNKVIKNQKQLPLIDLSIGNPDLSPNEIWTRVSHKTNLGTLIKHGFAQ